MLFPPHCAPLQIQWHDPIRVRGQVNSGSPHPWSPRCHGIPPFLTPWGNHTCTPMFVAALFTVAKTWKQPKCPSTDGLKCKPPFLTLWGNHHPWREMLQLFLEKLFSLSWPFAHCWDNEEKKPKIPGRYIMSYLRPGAQGLCVLKRGNGTIFK